MVTQVLPQLCRHWLVCLSFFMAWSALGSGSEVVVVYAAQDPDSREVAQYYAAKRGVPPDQIIGLDLPSGTDLSREDYTLLVQAPLLAELQDRRLMEFDVELPRSSSFGNNSRPKYRCTSSKIRYLLLCYGVPYRIQPSTNLKESIPGDVPGQGQRNEASVDSELALLPRLGQDPFWGWVKNPAYSATNHALLHPTNGVFLVSRLDGPDKEIAKGLVDKAITAEITGLLGHAYIDLRNIREGPYRNGDQWLTNMASVSRALGYSTLVDNQPETLPKTVPLSHIAIYGGWYTSSIDGPFTLPDTEFMPGAIAYHLHSFSAANLRSSSVGWTGPLLARGATVSMGSVHEPYLDLTPRPDIFLAVLGQFQMTVGEAGISAQPFLSWMNVVVGDPLYRPFKKTMLELEQEFLQTSDPRLPWAILRKVNFHLYNKRDPEILRQYLVEMPLTAQSAVLSEKVAMMHAENSMLRQAIEWSEKALVLPTSPQQRTRLLLNLAKWNETLDRPEKALELLIQVELERAHFKDHLAFRETQYRLARRVGNTAEADRLKVEVERLNPPPPQNNPTTP